MYVTYFKYVICRQIAVRQSCFCFKLMLKISNLENLVTIRQLLAKIFLSFVLYSQYEELMNFAAAQE